MCVWATHISHYLLPIYPHTHIHTLIYIHTYKIRKCNICLYGNCLPFSFSLSLWLPLCPRSAIVCGLLETVVECHRLHSAIFKRLRRRAAPLRFPFWTFSTVWRDQTKDAIECIYGDKILGNSIKLTEARSASNTNLALSTVKQFNQRKIEHKNLVSK